jgi:ATP-dependent Lon protease
MSPQDEAMQPVNAKDDTKPLPSDALIVVPVRDLVLFPEMVFPVSVGRPSSVAAIQQAVREQRQILLVLQRDPAKEELAPADLHAVGTVANVLRYVTTPDGNHHIVCQGVQRFRITDFVEGHPFLLARGLHLVEPTTSGPEIEARFLVLKQQIRDTLELLPQVPQELRQTVENTESAGALADLAASYLDSKSNEKQEILEALDLVPRLDKVTQLLSKRLEVLRISSEIGKQTKSSLDARQREMVLREQMAAIQRELGEDDSNKQAIADLDKAITDAKMPPEAETAARKELRRLQRTPEASAEHGMIRTYLDTLVELPWALPETQPIDIAEARKVLDADHFGLEKIKKRIVEYLAVRKLAPEGKAPILCFAGPPGVGKTSLGQSIARAMGRKFARVSLGGVHDEAEIRGHRRTYIGALPGTIIQAIRKAGSRDCVMMLDEIDKMGSGVHGDPSAAMLEVLDPEQNGTFRDNYLDVPFDLSRIVFIATANMLDTIPGPLRDRMEIIQLSGYTAGEKLQIARRYLVRRQLEANGLTAEQAGIDDEALRLIIERLYARGGRPLAGARDRPRAAPRRGAGSRRLGHQGADRQGRHRGTAGPGPLRERRGDAHQRARRGHRPRLDAGRRRHPVHRGHALARERTADPHRPARRRDEGECAGGSQRHEEQGEVDRHRYRPVREERYSRARAGRRHAQGRAERRRRDVHGARVADDRPHHPQRHRDDRRDQPARPRATGRRH